MIFFVRPFKYANFHREYYPSCATSCNEYIRPLVFLSTLSFVLSPKLNLPSLLKLAKKYLFCGEHFLSDILFLCRKVASKQRQF